MSICDGCYDSPKKVYLTRRWIAHRFPTSSDVRMALKVPRLYNTSNSCYSFSHILSSGKNCFCDPKEVHLHMRVHLMLKGTMLPPQSSPTDPLFFMHHGNLDRLFARWQQRVRPSKFEIPSYKTVWLGGCRECAIVPVIPPVTNEDMMVDTIALGYEYEDLDFGSVKATEKVASPFNTFIPPVERGCPQHRQGELKPKEISEIRELLDELKSPLRR